MNRKTDLKKEKEKRIGRHYRHRKQIENTSAYDYVDEKIKKNRRKWTNRKQINKKQKMLRRMIQPPPIKTQTKNQPNKQKPKNKNKKQNETKKNVRS